MSQTSELYPTYVGGGSRLSTPMPCIALRRFSISWRKSRTSDGDIPGLCALEGGSWLDAGPVDGLEAGADGDADVVADVLATAVVASVALRL